MPALDSLDCGTSQGDGYTDALSLTDGSPVLDFNDDGDVQTEYSDQQKGSSVDMRFVLDHNCPAPGTSILMSEGHDPEVFVGTGKVPSGTVSQNTANLLSSTLEATRFFTLHV